MKTLGAASSLHARWVTSCSFASQSMSHGIVTQCHKERLWQLRSYENCWSWLSSGALLSGLWRETWPVILWHWHQCHMKAMWALLTSEVSLCEHVITWSIIHIKDPSCASDCSRPHAGSDFARPWQICYVICWYCTSSIQRKSHGPPFGNRRKPRPWTPESLSKGVNKTRTVLMENCTSCGAMWVEVSWPWCRCFS